MWISIPNRREALSDPRGPRDRPRVTAQRHVLLDLFGGEQAHLHVGPQVNGPQPSLQLGYLPREL